MSETVLTPAAIADDEAVNYKEVTVKVQGVDMTFRFYLGFASRITHTPKGGDEVLVYQQDGVFHIPPNEQGKRELKSHSKLTIQGGPDQVDVELEIDDSPIQNYRGPIGQIVVKTRKNAKDPKHDKRVKVLKGAQQVQSVDVTLGVNVGKGGVFAYQDAGGGTTTVDNTANCCPPACDG
jgi:hypothetical protein